MERREYVKILDKNSQGILADLRELENSEVIVEVSTPTENLYLVGFLKGPEISDPFDEGKHIWEICDSYDGKFFLIRFLFI